MDAKSTRRSFVGGGVALAAAAGVVKLPDLVGTSRRTLAFEVDQISAAGPMPAFGTLLPVSAAGPGPLSGRLVERRSSRIAGRVTVTSIPGNGGIMQVHTLDLSDGTVIAVGSDTGSVFTIASGTGAFAGARGRVVVRGGATATPSLDVDLEL